MVAAGLSPLAGPDSPPGFLQQMYDAGAKGSFDAAAAHPYVFPGGLAADSNNGWSDVLRMHDVMVANGDGGKKIQVIKEVRAITNLGLTEAKALVESAPKAIKEGVNKAEAEDIKKKIEEAGGTVEIK